MTLLKEIEEAMESALEASYQYGIAVVLPPDRTSREAISARDSAAEDALRVAIAAALSAAREGALREAAKEVERMAAHTSREDEEQFVIIGAYGAAARAILALAPRPEPGTLTERRIPKGMIGIQEGPSLPLAPEPAPESEDPELGVCDERPRVRHRFLPTCKNWRPSPRSETTEDR